MRVSSPRILVNYEATRTIGPASEPDCLTGNQTLNWKTDLVTDSTLEERSLCKGKYKGKRGLRIHQTKTKAGCGKQLSDSQCKTPRGDKSEALSTQDSNHSDARGNVNQETTLKGIGSQSMEAMDKFTDGKKRIKMQGGHVGRKWRIVTRQHF